jgi:metallo-beta-lactamase class B
MHKLRLTFVIAAATALLSVPSVSAQDRRERSSERAIRALIEKFNACWNADNGPALVGEVLSEKAFVLARHSAPDATEAFVLNKAGYLEAFKQRVWKADLRKHEHRINSITVVGTLAYELGTNTDVSAGGEERSSDVLNVFAEEEAGWKLVFSTTPALFNRGPLTAQGGRAEPKAATKADLEAVRKLARDFVRAFESNDPTPVGQFEALLADDVVTIQSSGEFHEGKSDVVKFYREHIAMVRRTFDDAKLSWQTMSVKLLGDGATVSGRLIITGRKKEGGRLVHLEEWETLTVRKDEGGWRLTQEQCTTASSAKAAASDASGPAPAGTVIDKDLRIEPLTSNTWRCISYKELPQYGRVPANGLIVVVGDEVLLVDTPWTNEQTAQLCDWISQALHARVTAVIVTHAHDDRMGGLAEAHRRGAKSYALDKTAELARARGYEVPQNTFTDSRELKIGPHVIEMRFLGAGHTADNIVVWLPGEKILFGGCLFKSSQADSLGNIEEADLAAWPETVASAQALYADAHVIVPGHGNPGGADVPTHTLQLLQARAKK